MASSHIVHVIQKVLVAEWQRPFHLCILLCMTTVSHLPQPAGDARSRVAGEVRAWMARRGVTQTVLSAGVHIGQSQISKRLSGKIPFDVDELDRIAEFLGVDMLTLLGGAPQGGGPDGGDALRARRYSKPQPSDPKVRVYALQAA